MKDNLSVRLLAALSCLCLPTALAAAEPSATVSAPVSLDNGAGYQLGGAASRAALVGEVDFLQEDHTPARLSLPRAPGASTLNLRETSLGPATLFMGEAIAQGRDAVEMGTFLSRGQARAGISVTYLEAEDVVSRSEFFVDFAVTEQFSVGVSGILNTEMDEDQTVPQLGLSAEYATEGGAFLQGGVAGASDYQPVIGLSIGLRF